MANSDVDEGAPSDLSAEGNGYPSDLKDAEWARLEPLIPEASPGAPAAHGVTCCVTAFPPRSTVYNIFRKFQRDGVWEAIRSELHMALRERLGREASPSAAVFDSQSVKSAEKGAVMTSWSVYDAASRSRCGFRRKSPPR
jgi:putative transposase